jgi:hypothetical protein
MDGKKHYRQVPGQLRFYYIMSWQENSLCQAWYNERRETACFIRKAAYR